MATEPVGAEREPDETSYPFSAISAAAAEHYCRTADDRALVTEAELTAIGHRFLTVDHGDPEDDDQLALVSGLRIAAWDTRRVTTIHGGNDYLTIHVRPPTESGQPAAEVVLNQLELRAHELNPGWWRIRRGAR